MSDMADDKPGTTWKVQALFPLLAAFVTAVGFTAGTLVTDHVSRKSDEHENRMNRLYDSYENYMVSINELMIATITYSEDNTEENKGVLDRAYIANSKANTILQIRGANKTILQEMDTLESLSAPRRRVTPVEEGSTQTVVSLIW